MTLPAAAQPPDFTERAPRVHVKRPPRPPRVPNVHKPPLEFAPLRNDHPPHAPRPQLNPVSKPAVVVHVRPPHVQRTVAPIVKVARPPHPRTQHIIQHTNLTDVKPPIVIEQNVVQRPIRSVKTKTTGTITGPTKN